MLTHQMCAGKEEAMIQLSNNTKKFMEEDKNVKKWREALTAAANLSGYDVSKTANGREAECIRKLVKQIWDDTKPHLLENLIGMESHMQTLKSILSIRSRDVRMIGIWGMGGIGKTTIARAVFQEISAKFEANSFVKDVRENSSTIYGVMTLQKKILTEILMTDWIDLRDIDDGINELRRRLCNKKVLLVLDDVNNVTQLESLAASREWFGPGSRIIITTRDEHLLSDVDGKYKPDLLLIDQAIQLFSLHAFKKRMPPDGYEELSYRAVRYAGCLPLALKVLGSFFCGRLMSVWESALNRLAKAPTTEIYRTLKLSFDGLEDSEKKIFLDVACFFKGQDQRHVTRILDGFGFEPVIGISVLIEKSLLTVSKERLEMHDLIQEMGWQIVRQSFPNSRLWQLQEICDVMMSKQKLEAIEAIMLEDEDYYPNYREAEFSTEVFESTKNLRLLDVRSKFASCEPTYLPHELRWLIWFEYPFDSLSATGMHKLVGLEMQKSKLKELWKGQKILPNLKFIDLTGSNLLRRFPDLSRIPNLERLILSGCSNLVEVHPSVGVHKKLVYLNLDGCTNLQILPSSIMMESLETLILSKCRRIQRFPEISRVMGKLSELYLDHCHELMELPSSIRLLTNLAFLNLRGCNSLLSLPNAICELKHLKSLDLHDCYELQKLPEDIARMERLEELHVGFSGIPTEHRRMYNVKYSSFRFQDVICSRSLRKLDLSWCHFDEEDFPGNLHTLSSLEELYLNGNSNLIQLPASVSHLSHLKVLELSDCCRLEELQELPSGIQVLRANRCISLKKIRNLLEEYEWLYKVWFSDCRKLLWDQESTRYLGKFLQQSFILKCAIVNHRLSISIPESNIPDWFEEQQWGSNIAIKLPPNWQTDVTGFAICGMQHQGHSHNLRIQFNLVNYDVVIEGALDHNCIADKWNLWIGYIPISFFQKMYRHYQPVDWSQIEGYLVVTLSGGHGMFSTEFQKCGAHIVFKEDLQGLSSISSHIPDYGNLVEIEGEDDDEELAYDRRTSGNVYIYEEKTHGKRRNMATPSSSMSTRRDIYEHKFNLVGYRMIAGASVHPGIRWPRGYARIS